MRGDTITHIRPDGCTDGDTNGSADRCADGSADGSAYSNTDCCSNGRTDLAPL